MESEFNYGTTAYLNNKDFSSDYKLFVSDRSVKREDTIQTWKIHKKKKNWNFGNWEMKSKCYLRFAGQFIKRFKERIRVFICQCRRRATETERKRCACIYIDTDTGVVLGERERERCRERKGHVFLCGILQGGRNWKMEINGKWQGGGLR